MPAVQNTQSEIRLKCDLTVHQGIVRSVARTNAGISVHNEEICLKLR
jgi:hypothetical protein